MKEWKTYTITRPDDSEVLVKAPNAEVAERRWIETKNKFKAVRESTQKDLDKLADGEFTDYRWYFHPPSQKSIEFLNKWRQSKKTKEYLEKEGLLGLEKLLRLPYEDV